MRKPGGTETLKKARHVQRIAWSSAITAVAQDSLVTRGVDQKDIIEDYSYEETLGLLLLGRRLAPPEADLLRAVLASHVSHGITGQSTIAVRAAADCGTGFLNALFGGFAVGSGEHHQGALAATLERLEILASMSRESRVMQIEADIQARKRIPGYGHRFHTRDPRALVLVDTAKKHARVGPHLDAAMHVEAILNRLKGIYMNIEAAGGAILLDLGFDSRIAHLFIVLGRAPMFAAAYLERLDEGRASFQRLEVYDVVDGNDPENQVDLGGERGCS